MRVDLPLSFHYLRRSLNYSNSLVDMVMVVIMSTGTVLGGGNWVVIGW